MNYDDLLKLEPYSLPDEKKHPLLKSALRHAFNHHYENCKPYRKLCKKQNFEMTPNFALPDLPYIPVDLFKHLSLNSVPENDIVRVLKSSATSSQTPSSINIDNTTRSRQVKTLAWILSNYLGKERSPFIIMDVDPNTTPKDEQIISARTAAIRGFLTAASSANYCMTTNNHQKLCVDLDKFQTLLKQYEKEGKRVILFGYTYVFYIHVAKQLREIGITFDLSNAIILHIGGWKKLQSEAVSQEIFNKTMSEIFGISSENIMDAYGFTEQLGLLYINYGNEPKRCSLISEIIIRHPQTMEPVPDGEEGLIEFITPLPYSYPGIAILLDDIGVIVDRAPSASGRYGTAFKVLGRAKQAEIRGCGDIVSEIIETS